VVVVELNEDIIEPRSLQGSSSSGSKSIRIEALGGRRDVVRSGSLSGEVRSKLRDKSGVTGSRAAFDIEIDAIKNRIAKRSNGSRSTKKHVPHRRRESNSFFSRTETIQADTAAHRDQKLNAARLAVLNVRSDLGADQEKRVRVIVSGIAVIGEVETGILRAGSSGEDVRKTDDDDVVRASAIVSKRFLPLGFVISINIGS